MIAAIYAAVLFILLSPGVLVKLPPKGGKMTVVLVHALVFFVVFSLTKEWVYMFFSNMFEGFKEGAKKPKKGAKKAAVKKSE